MTALIDTHMHLIYPDIGAYGWTDDIGQLASKEFPVEAYQDLTAGTEIVGSLFMEAAIADDQYGQQFARLDCGYPTNSGATVR